MQTQQLNGAPFNQLSSFVQFQTQLPNRSYHKIKSSLKITFSNCLQLKEDNFYLLPKIPPYKNVLFNQRSKLSQHFHFYHEFIFWVFLNFPKSHLLYKRKIGKKRVYPQNQIQSNPIQSVRERNLIGFHFTEQTRQWLVEEAQKGQRNSGLWGTSLRQWAHNIQSYQKHSPSIA